MKEPKRGMLDKILDFEARNARVIGALLMVWMMTSWVFYTNWIAWPDIPFVTKQHFLWASVAFNAMWWGFARPKLMDRKTNRLAEREPG